jgi:hypothetical protein
VSDIGRDLVEFLQDEADYADDRGAAATRDRLCALAAHVQVVCDLLLAQDYDAAARCLASFRRASV